MGAYFWMKKMDKQIINTNKAPQAIGCYSQAVKMNDTIYLSGQIGLNPQTMLLDVDFEKQTHQVFKNLQSVVETANITFKNIVKLNIYVTDMNNFAFVNKIMSEYFSEPYPARAVVGVKDLPKGALIEADAIAVTYS